MKRRLCTLLLSALSATLMPMAAHATGHGAEAHVNWWRWSMDAPPVGWFLVDFVVFVGLLVYFTRRPLKKVFAARHETIKRTINDNERAYAKARETYDAARNRLAAIEQTALQLVSSIQESGATEHERIIANARQYAVRLREDTVGIMATELAAAKTRLRRCAADEALKLAEQTLQDTVTDAMRARMIDTAIAEIAGRGRQ